MYHIRFSRRSFAAIGLAVLTLSAGLVYAQAGGGYDLSWNSVDGGGTTFSSGGAYTLGGTAGQPDAGTMSGGAYSLTGGFWAAAASSPTATATPTGTSTMTVTATPSSTPTSTSTATPAPSGVIVGHVTWQGISQPNVHNTGVTATLTLCVGGVPQNYSVATDANGFFTATTGLPDGFYNWRFKGVINLAGSGVLSISAGTANAEMGTIRAGDCNNSNDVSSIDFSILKSTFGKSMGQAGYDDRADFNRDMVVNSTDFNLLKGSFGQGGGSLVCP